MKQLILCAHPNPKKVFIALCEVEHFFIKIVRYIIKMHKKVLRPITLSFFGKLLMQIQTVNFNKSQTGYLALVEIVC